MLPLIKRIVASQSWRTIILVGIVSMTYPTESALATQGHAGIEGVWVHQFAHLFFMLSMVLLIYWLRQAELVKTSGWRYIQYAAMFFILWNLETLLVHFLDEQIFAVEVKHLAAWRIRIDTASNQNWLAAFYYFAKLDHLLCVPAMICLWQGLRHMLREIPSMSAEKAPGQ